MSTKFLTIPSKTLATSINASSTTLKLSDVNGWDGVALTSAAIGDKLYATLRNPQGTLLEVMQLDPTSLSGTTFNITLRGLKFDGDLATEITANKLSWTKGSTIIEIGTDTPQLLNNLVRIVDAQTIAGIKTFSSIPVLPASNPTDDNQAARKAYVDLAAAGSAAYQKIISSATAGETVSAGQLVYQKTADNRWWLCDADTAGTVENVNLGIAQGAGTAGNAITNGVLTYGLDSNQTGLTANAKYYVSNTAGGISSSAGTTEVSIGFSLSTTSIYFTPRFDQLITEDIQDGLNSTTALSATNKVISQKDLQIGAEIYAADAQANDTYVITLSPVPSAYVTGMTIRFKANTANTGACTINVNSLGAKSIKKNVTADLTTGDIIASQIHTIIYDGTNFQIQSALGEVTAATAGKIAVRNSTGDITVSTTPTAGTDATSKTYVDSLPLDTLLSLYTKKLQYLTVDATFWNVATSTENSILRRVLTESGSAGAFIYSNDLQAAGSYATLFDFSKQFVVDFVCTAKTSGATTGGYFWGFAQTPLNNNSGTIEIERPGLTGLMTQKHIGFIVSGNADGEKFYASVSDGTTQSRTLITGYTLSTHYKFTIIRKASSVEFYIDGVLKATITTNLPTTPTNTYFEVFSHPVSGGSGWVSLLRSVVLGWI